MATRDGVLTIARTAEDAGLDSVWVTDHVVHPHRSDSVYPYRDDGIPWGPEDGYLDSFSVLAVVAGATTRLQLGTSVFVLPMRHPLFVTQTVATLDVLSGGRVILGIGAGWWKEEFDAVGAPFARRGARMDEQIEIMRALWRDGSLEHRGTYYTFDELSCRPLPVQPGGPPIWIGGMGETGLRRAARLGDGWLAVSAHAETLETGIAEVRQRATEHGRDADAIGLSTSVGLPVDRDRALERLVRLDRVGVGHVVLNLADDTVESTCSTIRTLGEELLPAMRARR